MDGGCKGPAPAGQFLGYRDVLDNPAFVPGFELLLLVVQSVVALMAVDPRGLIGCMPAGAPVAAGVRVGAAVVPDGLGQEEACAGVPGLGDPALDRDAPEECSEGIRPDTPRVAPVKRFQSPIFTAPPTVRTGPPHPYL